MHQAHARRIGTYGTLYAWLAITYTNRVHKSHALYRSQIAPKPPVFVCADCTTRMKLACVMLYYTRLARITLHAHSEALQHNMSYHIALHCTELHNTTLVANNAYGHPFVVGKHTHTHTHTIHSRGVYPHASVRIGIQMGYHIAHRQTNTCRVDRPAARVENVNKRTTRGISPAAPSPNPY